MAKARPTPAASSNSARKSQEKGSEQISGKPG
jgi:hypothetical protein